MRSRLLLAAGLLLGQLGPAEAGILFNRSKNNSDPAKRVPELIRAIQTDLRESGRADAAEELGGFDANAHPQVTPVLIRSLRSDPAPGVRAAAAESLARVRPISPQAGYALEQARSGDGSVRVRWAARTALWQYHLAGYRPTEAQEAQEAPKSRQTGEPPLAGPHPSDGSRPTVAGRPAPTGEPPLAFQAAGPPMSAPPAVGLPMPLGLAPVTGTPGRDEGPSLEPPG